MSKNQKLREAARQAMESGSFRELAKLYNESAVELVAEVLAKHTATLLKALHDLAIATPLPAVATPAEVTNRKALRAIVDAAWNEATESMHVPATEWADRIIDRVIAAQPSAAGVPEGFELNPREPTPEMFNACDTIIQGYGAKLVWQRMYDAAPEVDRG